MRRPVVGSGRLVVALACMVVVAGCTSTTSGQAVKAPDAAGSDGVVASLLDTGAYPIAAGRPFGVAGDNAHDQGLLEAHRIAEFAVGPWEVDQALRVFPGVEQLGLVGPVATPQMMRDTALFPKPLPDIAAAHGFVSGFSTVRIAGPEAGQKRGLHSVVLRFPDPAAAAAAAAEMATAAPMPDGADPPMPIPISGTPQAIAKRYVFPDDGWVQRVDSFTAHGPYVLYQSARATGDPLLNVPEGLVTGLLGRQIRRIDEFAPTELSALAQLPLDPTGQLLARTLWALDNKAPFIAGVWQPRGWLHFEDDPVAAAALFNTASVDVVTQRLTTVYQANNADGAGRIVDQFSEQLGGVGDVKPIDGVPGLPGAHCFERVKGAFPAEAPMTYQRVAWRYKCVAGVDRYVYTGFSQDPKDVRQQIAAQYRILSGE